jgi:hypothetical protein
MIVQTSARMIPPAILRRVRDRGAYLDEVARFSSMKEDDLLQVTQSFLRNVNCFDHVTGPDSELQLVLVPELWERLRPGTRDMLRRISSTLAEYNPDPASPSVFARCLSPEALQRLAADAVDLRQRLVLTSKLDVTALVEQVRFAIAGSRASDHWTPTDFVYEPGFVYRLVPAIAGRVLVHHSRRPLHD